MIIKKNIKHFQENILRVFYAQMHNILRLIFSEHKNYNVLVFYYIKYIYIIRLS